MQKIKRYCKIAKQKIDVDCPNIVKVYNKSMGGVDLSDMLTPFKSRRWYLGIFAQMIDISINNAWLLYRRQCGLKNVSAKPLKLFRREVSDGLAKSYRATQRQNTEKSAILKPVIARPVDSVRYDNIL